MNAENQRSTNDMWFQQFMLWLKISISTAAISILCAVIIYVANFGTTLSSEQSVWGAFGDFLGFLDPFISLLALVALFATIRLQVVELRLTRDELEKSSEALNGQLRLLRIQQFENTFFQMLRLHNDALDSLKLSGGDGVAREGRQKLNTLAEIATVTMASSFTMSLLSGNQNVYNQGYMKFFRDNERFLGFYFRLLYRVVKFIDSANITSSEKHEYAKILRSKLSSSELVLLFYNCVSELGNEKFKPLVENYALLKGLPVNEISNSDLIKEYNASAFGGKYPDA